MKLAFISDLHLSEDTPIHNQTLYALLLKWQDELDGLYILGDFFDSWCGDDDNNAFIAEMKAALSNFSRHKPIYFMIGNHDFALGKHFAQATGMTLIKDCTVLEIGRNRILLSHGDRFCTLDTKYQKMKKFLTNPLILGTMRRLPLAWRYKIKHYLEHTSTKAFNTQPAHTYQVVDTAIIADATKHKANIVIHGHTHKPNLYTIKTETGTILRFEIPDWATREPGGYVLLNNDSIKIHWA